MRSGLPAREFFYKLAFDEHFLRSAQQFGELILQFGVHSSVFDSSACS